MSKRKPESLDGVRIELQEKERKLLESALTTYRIKALYEPTLKILKDPTEVAGIIVSLWGIIALILPDDIDIPYFPDKADLNQIREGVQTARERRKIEGEANPDQGTWEERIGTIFYNLTNPNWSAPLDPDAPGFVEAFRDFLEDIKE